MNREESKQQPVPDYIRQFLKKPPQLLKNFHYEDLMEFLKVGEVEKYNADDVIIKEGELINSAYLVATGKVSIWKNNIQLTTLKKGSFLGEAFLFSKNYRMAKVVSEGASRLLHFQRYDTLDFFRKKPEKMFNIFTRNIIDIQQSKIKKSNDQIIQLKKQLLNIQ